MAQQYLSTDTEQNLSTGKGMVKRQHTKNFQQLDNPGRMQDHNSTSVGMLTENLEVEMADDGIEFASNRLGNAVDNSLLSDLTSSTEAHPLRGSQLSSMYSGEWPSENDLINNGPISLSGRSHSANSANHNSSICYSSTGYSPVNLLNSSMNIQPLGAKVEMVYSLLSMLDTHGKDEMSLKLLEMSKSPECCVAMRQSGCLPLLVQLLHGNQKDSTDDSNSSREAFRESRQYASQALHNIVHAHPDDKRGRREARVLRMLEQIRAYCDAMRDLEDGRMQNDENANKVDDHPGPAIAALMKLSFDEEHRHAICQLGGLQAIAELIKVDHDVHGNTSDGFCLTLRRYAGMALTNLTFGDGTNKALLCSMKPFMHSLVSQLHSPNEDLRQVTASVLRNLSWRADSASKKALRSVGVVTILTKSAMEATKESTLKSILSALWNLSAHCSNNKADICAVDGALAFLVSTLMYKSLSKTLSVVENGGGILRNISSHVALCEEYRAILRKHNCLQILLEHLKSPSLTIVSNACGTLWNLSARCIQDQRILWELGAVNMLRRLIHSRHKMIAMGSSAALKNLVTAKIPGGTTYSLSSMYESGHFGSNMPSLHVRKQRALEAEIDHNLSETYDNIDSPKNSPTHNVNLENRFMFQGISQPRYAASLPSRIYENGNGQIRSPEVSRSDSHDSLGSSHSEPLYPHLQSGAFRLISRNAKFVSPDHRHYSVKIAEWKDFQLSPLKDNCIPFGKSSVLLNPSYSFNDCSTANSETSKNGYDGNNLSNAFEFTKPEKELNLDNEEKNIESKESNNLDETVVSDEGSDRNETNNLSTSIIADSTSVKPTSHLSKLATIAQKIDLFNIEDQDFHEQPIDYSLKYREENMALLPDTCNQHKHDEHPPPKIDNYLQDTTMASRPLYNESSLPTAQCVSHWNNTQIPHMTTDEKNTVDCIRDVYSIRSFPESDTDNPDQPTDFSQKYAEHIDSLDLNQKEDNKLFEHCNEETRFNSSETKHSYINDDTIKVYCTEDTPLNFSSASSLTDLRDIHISTPSDTYSLKEEKDIRKVEIQSSSQAQQITSCSPKDSTDRRSEEAISEIKETEKLNLSPTKSTCIPEKEGKTVTFGEEVNYAEETPLMFSRCSSLGSLSSFEQHSIHDDHSSVISDFSRRASEVVSPSDLPDSPSQTLPPSPQRDKQSVFSFTEKSSNNDTENVSCLNLVSKTKNASMFEDCRISFSEEGMPPEFSRATSLSSLTIEDELKIPKELKLKDGRLTIEGDKFQVHDDLDKDDNLESSLQSGQTSSEKDSGPSSNEPSPSNEIEDKSDMSDAESVEDDILAACINSGMPNNNGYSNGLNNTKLRSKVNNLSSMSLQLKVSNIPTKTSNIRFTPPVSNISKSLVYSKSAISSNVSPIQNFGEDSLKVYKTEDTPSSLSHATSLSDLSNISCTDSNRSNEAVKSNRDNHSDSSSVCDENDNLLLKCIQSGLPQPKKRQMPKETDRCGDGASSPDTTPFKSKLPFINLRKSPDPVPLKINLLMNSQYKPQNNICHSKNNVECKTIKMYSAPSHSWQNINREKRIAQIREHQRSHSIDISSQSCSNRGTNGTYSYGLPDSPKTYETEGTPVNFSCTDSLSSLSCEDDSDLREQRKINFGCTEKSSSNKMVSKSPATSLISNIPSSHSLVLSSNTPSERYSQSYPFTQRTICKNHFENSNTVKQSYSTPVSSRENRQETFQEQDSIHANQIEGTPVTFSRNSSLSSLSMDSTDEPSSSEQALLEECISFGIPKDKSVRNKHSRNKSKLSCSESKLPVREHDQSYKNNKQNKTNDNINRGSVTKCLSFPVDEASEEKGMEDERTKEKQKFVSFGSLDDSSVPVVQNIAEDRNKEVVEESHQDEIDFDMNVNEKYEETDHNLQQESYTKDMAEDKLEGKNGSINDDSGLSVSTVIKLEAERIGEAIEELADDMTQSSISCTSDIENVNPPSAMDLNISLSSSGMAEWFSSKLDSNCKSRVLGKRIFKNTHKQIPEPVRRALAGNLDIMKISAGSDILCNLKPPSAMGSVENLSMKSSCTSELLENVNPPSLMDDISMIGSSASLNSVSSSILENHAVETNCANDMYEKLNAAATMVQVYSREYAAITNGSTKSSRSSDIIEHVKPPSMTHNITEITIEDVTEFATDTMESDTEIGEDLPCDDDTGSETLKATNISPLTKDEPYEGSTENLVSSFTDTDTLEYERNDNNVNHMETGHPLENMNITAEEMLVLQENAQLVVTTLNEIQMTGSSDSDPDAVNSNEMIEDETLSLVSNESDDDFLANEDSNSEKTMSEVSNDCTLQDDDITQSSNINNINTNTFTKKSAIDSSTFTRMKVPKTKVATANGSSNNVRMSFQSQINEDSVVSDISSNRLQNETSDDTKHEISTIETVQKIDNCSSGMLIIQAAVTKDKSDPENSAKAKTEFKTNNISKDGEVANFQSSKIDSSHKRFERKIPIGQNRISQYARTSSCTRNTHFGSNSSRNTSGSQTTIGKRENVEKSSSRCPSSASISTHSGSLGSCSNSNASLSSVSSSGTIPDKSSGSGKKEVGSKVASIWKAKEKTRKSSSRSSVTNKVAISPKATQITSSYSARKSTTPSRVQSPVPSASSPCEGSSTYEKFLANERRDESLMQKITTPFNPKSRNKIVGVCTKLDQSKLSSEVNRSKTSTASTSHIKGQHIPKENFRGQIPPPGSKSRLPTSGQKIYPPKMSPQKHEKGGQSENKPVSAIVSPFNYNPSTNIPKSKNDIVPSKSMIPSPKTVSSRTSLSDNHSEGTEGKRVRRTCLVTMV